MKADPRILLLIVFNKETNSLFENGSDGRTRTMFPEGDTELHDFWISRHKSSLHPSAQKVEALGAGRKVWTPQTKNPCVSVRSQVSVKEAGRGF